MHRALWPGCCLLFMACEAGTTEATPTPSATPRIRFFVDPRPQDGGSAEAEALSARYGDPIRVVVDGLTPGSQISLFADSDEYSTHADFVVAEDGSVDLGRDAPVAGAWSGVDPEALIWSMTTVTGPPATMDLTITVRVTIGEDERVRASLVRPTLDEGIVYEPVRSGRTIGAFCAPKDATAPLPAVLVFGGSEGGTGSGTFQCAYLAQLGFAALGVGYFGAAGLPSDLVKVPIEIIEEDLQYLAADPRVDAQRIGIMGGSRGGELALLAASHFPEVKAVVATVPSGIVFAGFAYPPVSAWTYGGVEVPYLGSYGNMPEYTTGDDGRRLERDSPATLADLGEAPAEDIAAATTRVEDITGPVLLLAGADDQLWPSCVLADIAYQRLVTSGHSAAHNDRSECYPNAGHGLAGTPGWSSMDSTEYYVGSNTYMVLGGTPQSNANAQRAADTAMRGFLESEL